MCFTQSLYVSYVQGKFAIINRDNSKYDDDYDTDDDDDDATGKLDEDVAIVREAKRPMSWRNLIVFICTITVMVAALARHGYSIIHRSLDDRSWYRCWQFIFYPWVSSEGFCEGIFFCLKRAWIFFGGRSITLRIYFCRRSLYRNLYNHHDHLILLVLFVPSFIRSSLFCVPDPVRGILRLLRHHFHGTFSHWASRHVP